MLEVYPESRFWLRQLRECAIGDRIDPFAESLQGAGFKRRSAQLLLRGAAHLGEWASIEQVRRHRTSGKSFGSALRIENKPHLEEFLSRADAGHVVKTASFE